ncbi:MAG: hypothetical protein NC830_05880 [Candidatus Omnitrophica bacterium]|nr:hypothetical protein [Candidatus Omnitrophota bacterium]
MGFFEIFHDPSLFQREENSSPLCFLLFLHLPLFKGGCKGDFENLPQPLFAPSPLPPFLKGDARGILKISPSPSLRKRGEKAVSPFYKWGDNKRKAGIWKLEYRDRFLCCGFF